MGPDAIRPKPSQALADDGELPPDVLFEVLIRFPANVLCRLRLVCQSWRSLTSDPIFARAHASRHPLFAGIEDSRPGCEICLFDLSCTVIKRIPLARPSDALNTQFNIACVSGAFPQSQAGFVMNLSTGEVIASSLLCHDEHRVGYAAISPFLLGHIPSTGEIKVFYSHMRTVHGYDGNRAVQVCCVATLGTNGDDIKWRVTPSPPAHVALLPSGRVAIGGVAYFLLLTLRNSANVKPDAIAVFDLAAEEWRPATLQGPLSSRIAGDDEKLLDEQYMGHVQLAAVNACLVTVHHKPRRGTDLWFLVDMDVDKGLWTKQYSIRSTSRFYGFGSTQYPLLLLDDGRIVISDVITRAPSVYDPRTDEWAGDIATLRNYYSMNAYRGNLLCPGLQM